MTQKSAADYQPLTPPLTWAERLADMLVMGVIIFWFAFLGVVPQKGRPQDLPRRPSNDNDRANDGEMSRLAAE